jgi:preprotein translocase subunit SecG
MFYQIILLFHTIAAACIIALVLVQQGKGATVGAAFGSGASQTVFGSRGSGSFLFKITMGLIVVFFLTSLGLNYLSTQAYKKQRVITLPVEQNNGNVARPVNTQNQNPAATDRVLPTVPAPVAGNDASA